MLRNYVEVLQSDSDAVLAQAYNCVEYLSTNALLEVEAATSSLMENNSSRSSGRAS